MTARTAGRLLALTAGAWIAAAPGRSSAQPAPAAASASPPAAAGATGGATGTGAAGADGGAITDDVFQWNSAVPDLFKTRTPDSPAFVLLGISPTEIQRPTTPKDVAVSLSSFVDASTNLTIPQNLSLEVAPYWLFSHPYLSADKYESGGAAALYRMFTISVGTRSSVVPLDMGGTIVNQTMGDLAIGGRTRIVDGRDANSACKAKIEAAAQEISAQRRLSSTVMAQLATKYGFGTPNFDEAGYKAALKAAKDAQVKQQQLDDLSKVGAECAKVLSSRRGFTLDLAGGSAWRFPDAKISTTTGHLLQAGGWTAGAYTWTNASLLGLGRLGRRALDSGERQTVGDLGVRGLYAADRLGASLEALYRHRFSGAGETNTYRVDATVEYRVGDGSWISITFGKEFADTAAGSLFSLANFSWGFGDRKIDPTSVGAAKTTP
jgi:hypothetical protein